MTDGFKKEEVIVDGYFDEHHHACSDDVEKGDNIDHSQTVEDHVTWTSQGFGEARHDAYVVLLSATIYENEIVVEIVRLYNCQINDRVLS